MNNQLIMEMTRYYSGDPKHIQHFMKVYAYARMIGEMERLDRKTQHMLETAAIVHDIGTVSYTHLDVYKRQTQR